MNILMDREEIKKYIPHRDPFLYVDKVLELEPYKRIIALRTFRSEEEFFKGHFPGYPIVPGVLLIESFAQAGAILYSYSLITDENATYPEGFYLVRVDQAKFRNVVNPDDEIKLEVEVDRARSNIVTFKSTGYVADSKVVEAEIMATYY